MNELIKVLQKKSAELNLFSAGDRLKLGEKHIPDALAVLNFWGVQPGEHVADIGTGGGIPGLVLADAARNVNFTLVDATAKKVDAVLEMAGELGLENVAGLYGRFEELAHDPHYREKFDAVVARAVAELPVLLEYVSGFLKVGGSFWAWKAEDYAAELASSTKAQEILKLKFVHVHKYELPSGEARVILEFKKTGPLPGGYPRKNGTPKAKPLV
jgi:16S rRNA (guanine527-N7)-methyltransferase